MCKPRTEFTRVSMLRNIKIQYPSQLRLTHTVRDRICIYRLPLLSQPDLPLSTFMPTENRMLKFWPFHALVQEKRAQHHHVRSYGLQVQVSSMSNLIIEVPCHLLVDRIHFAQQYSHKIQSCASWLNATCGTAEVPSARDIKHD